MSTGLIGDLVIASEACSGLAVRVLQDAIVIPHLIAQGPQAYTVHTSPSRRIFSRSLDFSSSTTSTGRRSISISREASW